jgi:multisubunit Na+/H+ antiporter MnhB subunit
MASNREHGMTLIVKTVTRLTLGFILLYGIYIALFGHVSPGGGFVGGFIIALSFVHIMLAFGKEVAMKRLHSHGMRYAINTAALIFLIIVITGLGHRDLLIPLCQMAIVSVGLFTIFIALVLLCRSEEDMQKKRSG